MKSASGMQTRPFLGFTLAIAIAVGLVALPGPTAHAQGFEVLYTFSGTPDGAFPYAGVITDPKGNIYGTTWIGGAYGLGSVYRLTPAGQETRYSFAGGTDGAYPYSSLLLNGGALWGTTSAGGGGTGCFGNGCGIVFRINAAGKETVVYRFTGGTDGGRPFSALTAGRPGTLYGTTSIGGDPICGASRGCGTVFSIDTRTGKEKVLYSFTDGTDGAFPEFGSLAFDSTKGILYGTTQSGGNLSCNPPFGCGEVFQLTRTGEKPIHFFGDEGDGTFPASMPFLSHGDLFGTTPTGGAYGKGTLYRIDKNVYSILHNFGLGADGATPLASVSIDPSGNLYIPTEAGGSLGYGALVKVDTAGIDIVLHDFNFSEDGGVPIGNLWFDPRPGYENVLYGTAFEGGSTSQGPGSGTVFRVILK